MSYEELEKLLYTTLQSKVEINDLCEKLQMRYEKLLEHITSRDDTVPAESNGAYIISKFCHIVNSFSK